MRKPDGIVTNDPNVFGHSWVTDPKWVILTWAAPTRSWTRTNTYIDTDAFIYKQPPFPCLYLYSCKKPNVTVPVYPCTDGEQDLYESSGYCGILLDKKGPFAVCHPKVNPNVSANTHKHVMETHCTCICTQTLCQLFSLYELICLSALLQGLSVWPVWAGRGLVHPVWGHWSLRQWVPGPWRQHPPLEEPNILPWVNRPVEDGGMDGWMDDGLNGESEEWRDRGREKSWMSDRVMQERIDGY